MIKKIQRVNWALLSEWWCAPLDATADEVAEAIFIDFRAPRLNIDFIKQRLYGGFKCDEKENRHIFHATGNYTYTGNSQSDHFASERVEDWERLLKQKPNNNFIGGGPCIEDYPFKLKEAVQ